jgi:hypothetical protein
MMNNKQTLIAALLIVAVAVIGLTVYSSSPKKAADTTPAPSAETCSTTGADVYLTVNDDGFDKPSLSAHRCDRLVLHNAGSQDHWPALGSHPHHIQYPGLPDRVMQAGETRSVVLVEAGDFEYHDHLNEEQEGQLDISR